MPITPFQKELVRHHHALGANDRQIAAAADISISSVKRVRQEFGLSTTCPVNLRGRIGERLVAEAARQRGLKVELRPANGTEYDLRIQDLRVDVKAAAPSPGGTWRFRLPDERVSFFGQYTYAKDYEQDADLIVLAAMNSTDTDADLYILPSHSLPTHVLIRPGSSSDVHLNAWHLFPASATPLSA